MVMVHAESDGMVKWVLANHYRPRYTDQSSASVYCTTNVYDRPVFLDSN